MASCISIKNLSGTMPLFQSSWVLWSKYPLWRQPSNLMKGDQQVIFFSVSQVFLRLLRFVFVQVAVTGSWSSPPTSHLSWNHEMSSYRLRVILFAISTGSLFEVVSMYQAPWKCFLNGSNSYKRNHMNLWLMTHKSSRSSSLSLSLSISAWRFERFHKSSWYSWHLASLWLQYV